jgi:DNA-binding SARP family transcriptional activator
MALVVRLLGPLELECKGQPVRIGAAKERLVIVVLGLNAGRVVPTARLVDSLWGDDPPDSASVTVRVLISRVRKTLAAAGCCQVIGTRPLGYVMVGDAVDIDVDLFWALAARGRAELAAGATRDAAATLNVALALWRGDRLAESGGGQLEGESARLTEARLATLEVRIEAELADGRHAEVVGELEELCHDNRLRERLWGQRILALYRCGRQADALAAYQELRTTLAEELGLDPSGELRRLENAVLAQDPALAAPAVPEPMARSPGPPDDAAIPLPAPLEVTETAPCIGRDGAQRELAAVWGAVLAGEPRMVLVRGEAGVGKTRLVREAGRAMHRRGAVVLHGRCDEDIAIPYRPIRECLAHYLTSACDGRLAEHDRHCLAEIPRLVPELERRMPDLPVPTRTDPDVERYLLFSAIAHLLGEIASGAPLVLVLDDLHWADQPTVQLLRHIAGAARGRVLVLGTYRDKQLLPGQPLTGALAALSREPTVGHIHLTGLTEPAVASIMEAMAGHALDEVGAELASALARETGGNAFLVVEEIRHLRDAGALEPTDDGHGTVAVDLASLGLAHSVYQVVAGRLDELGDEARSLLLMASVIGEQFDLSLLCAAGQSDEDLTLDVLEAAERQALVTEAIGQTGTFRFAHALVRHAVSQQLGTTQRARLHTRVGEALEQLCGDDPDERTPELAQHFLAGWPTDAAKAARYARLAGERALTALAPAEALRWFTEAIEALRGVPDDRERLWCLVGLGDAQRQLGIPGAREILLDAAHRARRLSEPQLLIRAALASNRGFFAQFGQIDTDLVVMLEAALGVCPPDSPQRVLLLSRLAAELAFHPDVARRCALADKAVAVARSSGDVAALLDALTRPDTALMIPELSDHRLSRLREAQALADRVKDPVASFWAAHQFFLLLVERADPQNADHCLQHAEKIAAQVDQPVLRWVSSFDRCCLALLAGEVDEADRLASDALKIGTESGQRDAESIYNGQVLCIRWHQGRLDEIIPVLLRMATEYPDFLAIRPSLAFAELLSGEPGHARRLLGAAAETGFELPRTVPWLFSTCVWAEVAAELDDHNAAPILYQRLLPWHQFIAAGGPSPLHSVAQSLGRLATIQGRFQDAEEHFAEALTIHHRMRAPFCIAATQLAWGRLLLSRDPDRAAPLLTSAAKIAARHGYRYLQSKICSGDPAPRSSQSHSSASDHA